MKKISSVFLVALTLTGFSPAFAGGYATLEPVNSSAETIKELEAELDNLSSKLKAANSKSLSLESKYEKKIAYLQGLIDTLKAEKGNLSGDVSTLTNELNNLKALRDQELADNNFLLDNFISPFITAPLGTVLGAVRGGVSKSLDHSEDFTDAIGSGFFANLIGRPTGFVTGLVTGVTSGAAKGLVDGVVVGVKDPFSKESISMAGDYTDFNSYKVFGSDSESI
ncbi:MAG: hypothetical protein HRT47_08660 [Candidatus Caenarcaniphilales bacterium]|nr:hypothetical protein [Candidatus Caenarcaniphilales bacterium]